MDREVCGAGVVARLSVTVTDGVEMNAELSGDLEVWMECKKRSKVNGRGSDFLSVV